MRIGSEINVHTYMYRILIVGLVLNTGTTKIKIMKCLRRAYKEVILNSCIIYRYFIFTVKLWQNKKNLNICSDADKKTSDSLKIEPYINCLCDFIMTFLANPHFILQISHAKTFKISILGAHTIVLSKNIHKVTNTDYVRFEFLWIRL